MPDVRRESSDAVSGCHEGENDWSKTLRPEPIDYYRNREQAELAAAEHATSEIARAAHLNMAKAYARMAASVEGK